MNEPTGTKNNHLVLSALGEDKPGLINELSRCVLNSGCSILDSRMAVLGGDFALLLQVGGNWNNLAKLETQLPGPAGTPRPHHQFAPHQRQGDTP